MRVSENFILREIAGEHMLVPVGAAASKFDIITMNEVGGFIFKALQVERTEDELVNLICGEYSVDADTARTDLEEFIQQLRDIGALVAEV